MRLINTDTYLFEEFLGRDVPEYAILSHTWEEEEMSYADYIESRHPHKKGFTKIYKTCELAAKENIRYAWVDTCCIDKRSSAEFTEAINSMFRWYQRATVCYAFLSDLPAIGAKEQCMKSCRWFTRGWTLQELIAPHQMSFFDMDWEFIGSKSSLSGLLSDITKVPSDVFSEMYPLAMIPVAEKMSWASGRTTTRIEDTAYCLLGLFDVNLPLMYGEEERAFQRLQEAIINQTPDLSIFAWISPLLSHNIAPGDESYCGVLAESPNAFSWCATMRLRTRPPKNGIAMSNNCVKIDYTILAYYNEEEAEGYHYGLPIHYHSEETGSGAATLGVVLRKVGSGQFLRSSPHRFYNYLHHSRYFSVCRGTHQLLLRAPTAHMSREFPIMPSSLINEEYVMRLRPRSIRFRLGPGMWTRSSFPASRYDHRDNLFFVSDEGDFHSDWGILGLSVEIDIDSMCMSFPCALYTTSWARRDGPQCSIVSGQAYKHELRRLQSDLAAWDHGTGNLLDSLYTRNIPRASRAILEVPGTTSYGLITITCTARNDIPDWMPRGSAWDVHVTSSAHDRGRSPPPVTTPKRWTRYNDGRY